MRLSNNEVLEMFLRGEEASNYTKNLHSWKLSNGVIQLINYNTVIAKITEDGVLLINHAKYSQTTSKHQNYLKRSGRAFELLSEHHIRVIDHWKKSRLKLVTGLI